MTEPEKPDDERDRIQKSLRRMDSQLKHSQDQQLAKLRSYWDQWDANDRRAFKDWICKIADLKQSVPHVLPSSKLEKMLTKGFLLVSRVCGERSNTGNVEKTTGRTRLVSLFEQVPSCPLDQDRPRRYERQSTITDAHWRLLAHSCAAIILTIEGRFCSAWRVAC